MFGLKLGKKRRKTPAAIRLVKAATRGAKVGAKLGNAGQKREGKR